MNKKRTEGLRLRAEDAEDLGILAAVLQDARAPLREMVFDPKERRFMAAFTRYMRERLPDPGDADRLDEMASILVFEEIAEVRHRGLDTGAPDAELVLLTIATRPGRDRALHIDLVFDGGGAIRLICDRIRARLQDHGEPRPCTVPPKDHFADEQPVGEA